MEIGEQLPRLVFGGLDAGQITQPVGVIVAVGDPGLQVHVLAVRMGDELDLIDLETELMEAIDTLGDSVVLVSLDAVFGTQFPPEGVIASRDVLTQMEV